MMTPSGHGHTPGVEAPTLTSTPSHDVEKQEPVIEEKKEKTSLSIHSDTNVPTADPILMAMKDDEEAAVHHQRRTSRYRKLRTFLLCGLALLILGWWISATVLPATRRRW